MHGYEKHFINSGKSSASQVISRDGGYLFRSASTSKHFRTEASIDSESAPGLFATHDRFVQLRFRLVHHVAERFLGLVQRLLDALLLRRVLLLKQLRVVLVVVAVPTFCRGVASRWRQNHALSALHSL